MTVEIKQLEDNIDVISIKSILEMLWRGKVFIIAFTGFFSLCALLYALTLPNIYKSSAIYLPVSAESGGGGLAKLASQFGGLASMAGINIDGASEDKTEVVLTYLKSRAFLQYFIEKRDLLIPLMASEGWDKETNKLIIDQDIFDEKSGQWVRDAPPGFNVIPTAWEAYETLRTSINAAYISKQGYVSIEVFTYSPETAVQWHKWLIEDLNLFWKQRESDKLTKRIDYLLKQAQEAQLSELKTVYFQLAADQIKNNTLAQVSDEVLLESLGTMVVPEYKDSPSRAILCIVAFLIAFVLSSLISLIYFTLSKKHLISVGK
ncbi:Wzz/FepE/Etk N-terminal domain-containing protein [Shewanella aestuarii]|uniref:LPS O-antigen length regulator n=1 Tax=Shewanella aestuarii TaxID=1028752 RepID=A0A6G9QKP7_9GAMM|nr:Wzz/FepE/Etk N-terminal domain-containing protein [Shewanella aestuarii]QIR15106.1 LPS O-antigen length regulator [Shewanella aestuarii]